MQLHELKPLPNSRKKMKRVGRGEASGHGKTSTKGNKGQRARSSLDIRLGFEGGQMPITRRIPKRGFTNIFKKEYEVINLNRLNNITDQTVIDADFLINNGFIKNKNKPIKILGQGTLSRALTFKVDKYSKSAKALIEKAGGKIV
jgi:large subunit ribosomal protein L15